MAVLQVGVLVSVRVDIGWTISEQWVCSGINIKKVRKCLQFLPRWSRYIRAQGGREWAELGRFRGGPFASVTVRFSFRFSRLGPMAVAYGGALGLTSFM